jgi:DNA polymerase III subunit delta
VFYVPIYVYWGEDEFAIAHAVKTLKQQVLEPNWEDFNFNKITPEQPNAITQALNQAMTPPFGMGNRLVWLVDTTLVQRCSEDVLAELDRTLPNIPDHSFLLLTARTKPDGRLKSTKLLQKHAEIREFPLIPTWKTELLTQQVRQVAQEYGIKLSAESVDLFVEAVGNNTRQLHNEMEKLRLYADSAKTPLGVAEVASLVTTSTQTSLQLVDAIRQGAVDRALELVTDLLSQNEPPAVIATTLINQFRLRLWVKLMLETGERNEQAIAQAAELSNPKRLYYLKQEIAHLSLNQLQQALPLLLELDYGLKGGGAEVVSLLQTKVIELCQLFQPLKAVR